jgi:hypothetical protein
MLFVNDNRLRQNSGYSIYGDHGLRPLEHTDHQFECRPVSEYLFLFCCAITHSPRTKMIVLYYFAGPRHYATNRKVVGSITDEVIWFCFQFT